MGGKRNNKNADSHKNNSRRLIFFRKKNREVKMMLQGQPISLGERLFQIVVLDYSKRNNNRVRTIVVPTGNTRRKIDIIPEAPRRTLVKRFKSAKAAMRYGSKFGTVISCHKVDTSPYLLNIEHLNLGEPRAIEIDRGEFVLGEDVVIVDKEE